MGNVAQLAVDLLVTSLEMKKVGVVYDDSFLPVVGNNPYVVVHSTSSCDPMTCMEGTPTVQKLIVQSIH